MCDVDVDASIGAFEEEVKGSFGWLPPYAQGMLIEKAQTTIATTHGALKVRVAEVAKTRAERDVQAAKATRAEAARAKTAKALGEAEDLLTTTKSSLSMATVKLDAKTVEHAKTLRDLDDVSARVRRLLPPSTCPFALGALAPC